MKSINIFNSINEKFWESEFTKEVKGRLFTIFGLTGTGIAPSIEPTKTFINSITTQDVIEILQVISLCLSILVAVTVLYKFFKTLKNEDKCKEDKTEIID